MVKYPEITVQLTGEDGNAFRIIGAVKNALRKGKVPEPQISYFMQEAMSSDYDNLLRTCMDWVTVN